MMDRVRSVPGMSSEVSLEFRRVNLLRALAWLLWPPALVLLMYASGSALLLLRGNARGRGDFTLTVIVLGAAIGLPAMLVYAYTRSRHFRGVRLCRVVPPRSMIGAVNGRTFAGLAATSPLHLYDGRLFITDHGHERALSGKIDKVVIGTCGKRWCSFVEFTGGGETRRVQALGRLRREIVSDLENAAD